MSVPAHYAKASKFFTGNDEDRSEAIADVTARVDAAISNMTTMAEGKPLTEHPYTHLDFTTPGKPKVVNGTKVKEKGLAAVQSWRSLRNKEPSAWQAVSQAVSAIAPYTLLVDGSTCTFFHIKPDGAEVVNDTILPDSYSIEHCTVHVEDTAKLLQMVHHLLRTFDPHKFVRWASQETLRELKPCACIASSKGLNQAYSLFKKIEELTSATDGYEAYDGAEEGSTVGVAYTSDGVPKSMHDEVVPWAALSENAHVGRGAHGLVFDVVDASTVLGCKQVCSPPSPLVVKVSHGAGVACMDVYCEAGVYCRTKAVGGPRGAVPRYHGICAVEGGRLGLVLDKVGGVHVAELDPHEYEAFAAGVLSAVEELVSEGIVHGDVRAANVLFNRDTQMVQLVDLANAVVKDEVSAEEWHAERDIMSQQVEELLQALPTGDTVLA